MPDGFTVDEIAQLRSHGVVLFADRVIYEAQPPMPPEQVAEVAERCNGGLPDSLLALWQVTAGGRLDYDLSLTSDGNRVEASWAELFYNDSDGYHDLTGWIDAELDLQREVDSARDEPPTGKLDAVPIGGFEYTDRIYVITEPGARGRVVAWMMALPPAWNGPLKEDTVLDVAADLPAAFRRLRLDADPLKSDDGAATGVEFLEYVDERRSKGLSGPLADKLIDYYRRAIRAPRT